MKGWEAWEVAFAGQAMAHAGVTLTPNAIDRCDLCGVEFRRRNAVRHYVSRRHRNAVRRSWEATATLEGVLG